MRTEIDGSAEKLLSRSCMLAHAGQYHRNPLYSQDLRDVCPRDAACGPDRRCPHRDRREQNAVDLAGYVATPLYSSDVGQGDEAGLVHCPIGAGEVAGISTR